MSDFRRSRVQAVLRWAATAELKTEVEIADNIWLSTRSLLSNLDETFHDIPLSPRVRSVRCVAFEEAYFYPSWGTNYFIRMDTNGLARALQRLDAHASLQLGLCLIGDGFLGREPPRRLFGRWKNGIVLHLRRYEDVKADGGNDWEVKYMGVLNGMPEEIWWEQVCMDRRAVRPRRRF
jgi:hypothetical protein